MWAGPLFCLALRILRLPSMCTKAGRGVWHELLSADSNRLFLGRPWELLCEYSTGDSDGRYMRHSRHLWGPDAILCFQSGSRSQYVTTSLKERHLGRGTSCGDVGNDFDLGSWPARQLLAAQEQFAKPQSYSSHPGVGGRVSLPCGT